MQLNELICNLRDKLLVALNTNNRDMLLDLYTTFSVLRDVVTASQNADLLRIFVQLEDAAQEGTMGVMNKHAIPTIDAIKAAATQPMQL